MGALGNFRHGVYAEVAVRPEVLDEVAVLYARAEWLDPIRDGNLVEATARLVVRLRKLDAALSEDPTNAAFASLYGRAEAQLVRNLDALGLTPTAAARLGLQHWTPERRHGGWARRLAEYRESERVDAPERHGTEPEQLERESIGGQPAAPAEASSDGRGRPSPRGSRRLSVDRPRPALRLSLLRRPGISPSCRSRTSPSSRCSARCCVSRCTSDRPRSSSEIYRDGCGPPSYGSGDVGQGTHGGVVAVYEATVNAARHTAAVPPGERVTVAIIATCREQAKIVHGYVRDLPPGADLAHLVEGETEEEVRLSNGVSGRRPCRAPPAPCVASPVRS